MGVKKNSLLYIIIFFLIIGFIVGAFSRVSFAIDMEDDDVSSDEKPNILVRSVTKFFKFVARLTYGKFDGQGMSIDSMVFNEGDGQFSGLSLFKKGELQDFLAGFYNLFNYIAIAIFIPIAYSTGISFIRAADNPQGKSLLKDRIIRIVITMVLLYTMPQLLTVVVKISNALVDIFKGMGSAFFGDLTAASMIDSHMEYVKAEADIVDGISSLMLVGINLWLVAFYVIRDITICFLFLFFPIIAVWHPLSKNMVKGWWRNMLGNILAQPIQAVVLTMVLSLSKTLPASATEGASFATSMYTIIAFGSIIPMTSIVKSFMGLETGIGAGSSRAGLGGIMGAMMLARGVGASIGKNKDKIGEGVSELMGNSIASTREDKNLESIGSGASVVDDLQKPLVSPKSGSVSVNDLTGSAVDDRKKSNRRAVRQIASGVGGIGGGVAMAAVGTSVGAGIGSREAVQFGLGGYALGSITGSKAAHAGVATIDAGKQTYDMKKDIESLQVDAVMENEIGENNEALTREEAIEFIDANPDKAKMYKEQAMNKYVGLSHKKIDGTEYQAQEKNALMKKKQWQNMGVGTVTTYMAERSYANITPTKKSPKELSSIDNALYYQDKDISLAYIPNENGGVGEVLSRGEGNPYVKEPIVNPISFDSPRQGIPGDRLLQIEMDSRDSATQYMNQAYPLMDRDSTEYQVLHSERQNHYKREMNIGYQKNLDLMRQNLNMPNMNIKTNEKRLKDLAIEEQMRRLKTKEEKIRQQTYMEDIGKGQIKETQNANINMGLS